MKHYVWKSGFRYFLPVFVLLLTALVTAPAAAMDLSTLSFSWALIEPKPVVPPVLLTPPGVCRIEHRFTVAGVPTPVPEEVYNRLEAVYEPVIKKKREDLETLLKNFVRESGTAAGKPNPEKIQEKALEALNRGYESLLLQELSNDLFEKGEQAWEEFSRKNAEFASITMDQLFSLDAATILRERRTAHSLVETFPPRAKTTAPSSYFSLPPDKPVNGRSRYLSFRIPLFTAQWPALHEPLGGHLNILVSVPAVPGDEKSLFAFYGGLRKKLDFEQAGLQKSLQQFSETIERQTALGTPAPDRLRVSRQEELTRMFADFQKQLLEMIQREVQKEGRWNAGGKAEIRFSPDLQTAEIAPVRFLELPPIPAAAPGNLSELVKQLKALKIPERYNEFRKQHIMPNGGVAVTIGMFLSTLEAQKNVTSVADLFTRKSVAAFYQSALESVLKAEEKAMLQALEISDVIRELLYLQRRLQLTSPAFSGLPQLQTVISQLQGFYGYLVRSRSAFAQFLALGPHAALRAGDPAAADTGAYHLIQLPVSQLVHHEMGGPKGNSPEYLARMNLFQARVYEDALLQLEKRIQ